eukprot:gene9244-9408_t
MPRRVVPTLISKKRTCQIPSPRAKAAAGIELSTSAAVSTIKQAVAKPNSVPSPVVLDAVLQLEAEKLPTDGWLDALQAPGSRWRLVFTADTKQVQAAKKKQPNKGGVYFPLPACQKFENGDFENGVFLGPIASMTFNGPFSMKGRQITFDVVAMNIGIGPWKFSIPLKKGAVPIEAMDAQDAKKLPFFLYSYVDSDIVVARGRSGGQAVWQRATKEWEAKAGVLQRYS